MSLNIKNGKLPEENRDMRQISSAKDTDHQGSSMVSKEPPVNKADEGAGCFSKLLLLWFTPLLRLGIKQELTEEDLGQVAYKDEPTRLRDQFNTLWKQQKPKNGKRSLKMVFIHIVGVRTILLCAFYATIRAGLLTALPFVSKAIIDSFQDPDGLPPGKAAGYVLIVAFFPLLAGFCESQLNLMGRRGSTHLYESFTMAIYNKSLRLSSAARAKSSVGQTVTMMSTDAGTSLERVLVLVFPFLIAPIQFAVLIYLLYTLIGISMLTGVIIIVVAVPVNAMIFIALGKAFRNIMGRTDERMKLVNEMVGGIRIIKSYAWEIPFLKNLTESRNRELVFIKKHAYLFSLGISVIFLQLPILLQVATFTTFYLVGGILEPGIVFTALQLFVLLQQIMTQLPSALNQVVSTLVALRRIRDFLELEELQHDENDQIDLTDRDGKNEGMIDFESCTFSWGVAFNPNDQEQNDTGAKKKKDNIEPPNGEPQSNSILNQNEQPDSTEKVTPVLEDINLELKSLERIAVYGPVGAGKSSLLMSSIGELEKLNGRMQVKGSVAYAAQKAWIVNATIRDNILFGKEYDEARYRKIVLACALLDDIKQMPAGDMTTIGERGINLSGGQKARVSLARAVYSDSSILLLDDPLAAVDAHVGDHIFNKCIMSDLLDGKLVLLVTNKAELLPKMDRILVLKDGKIVANGTYNELIQAGVKLEAFQEKEKPEEVDEEKQIQDDLTAHETGEAYFKENETLSADLLYQEEDKEVGHVKLSVYKFYAAAMGYSLALAAFVFTALYLLVPLATQYILSFWSNEVLCEENGLVGVTGEGFDCTGLRGQDFWFTVYLITFGTGLICCIISGLLMAESRVIAVRSLHRRLAATVFYAPISFFDITPIGRILNRFSKDINLVDTQLTIMLTFSMVTIMSAVNSFIGICLGTRGIFLIVLVPVLLLYLKIFTMSRRAAIRLQRLEAITRSPIYSRFSELLNGISTVRAYNQADRFRRENENALRRNVVPYFFVRTALPAWLMISLNMLGVFISGGVAAIVVIAREFNFLSGGEAGLALTFSLNLSQILYFVVFITTELEILMNAVERLKDYIENVPREGKPSAKVEDAKTDIVTEVDDSWPSHGSIEFISYTTGYREGPDVLKDLTFSINDNEKVGIVGRTGSGKSTMILSLLRIVEARKGRIMIGGVNIAEIPLELLRKRLGLIPQDPVCFIGSLRYNLDPFGEQNDDDIWKCLEKVQLKDFVESLPEKLNYMIQESGENISVGQRQLLSIARALLRNSKILMLDEATASVDNETDALIQLAIRESFAERTVLTIAHRLETILDSDRVLVLSEGKLIEFDTPAKLMAEDDGIFANMVKTSKKK